MESFRDLLQSVHPFFRAAFRGPGGGAGAGGVGHGFAQSGLVGEAAHRFTEGDGISGRKVEAVFADGDEIDWNACRGQHSAEAVAGLRDCTAPDPSRPGYTMCGLKDAGDCRSFSPESPDEFACRSYDGDDGTYGDCHAAGQQGQPYREVITTYLSD